jgi:hypothetical protein
MDISEGNRRLRLWDKLFILSPFWLTSLHCVLQFLDWATTLFLTIHLGSDIEVNPLMRYMLEDDHGMWWFTGVKLFYIGVLAFMIPWSIENSPEWEWVWRLLTIMYLAVVLNNLVGVATFCILS